MGTGHGGDLDRARELIHAARDSGADCAKFQMVIANEILHPNTGSVPLPGGSIPLYERFRALERNTEFYSDLKRICGECGIGFMCSPFGIGSARALRSIGVDRIKIASPELNYVQLLREVAGYGIPLILSSGVSRLSDIEEALDVVDAGGNSGEAAGNARGRVTLLHCVTAYPAPSEDYNLRLLPHLSAIFGVSVGVSDHSLDPEIVPALAVTQGAGMIEKHITLRKSDPGLDDPVALEPPDFTRMVRAIRRAEGAGSEETLAAATRSWGNDLVSSVLGSGRKTLAASERDNYGRTNRSIHACNLLTRGAVITDADVAVLRTEKVLRPGLHPRYLTRVVGARVVQEIPPGEGIRWEDLLAQR